MGFATITTPSAWASRFALPIIRPAVFVYLDWPTGIVRASTHHKPVTIFDDSLSPAETVTWSGVGNVGFVEAPEFRRNGALVTYKVGLSSLPQEDVDDDIEPLAIGRRALIYLGLFDEAWENPILKQIFIGHIISAGDFRHRRLENGDWVTDASVEISNGRNPRRRLENNHSPETAEGADTAWRLLPTVGRGLSWPTDD